MATTRQVPTLLRHIRRLATAQKLAHLSDRELLQRFAGERDEAAFAVLVKRHGSMVLHVGQRVLHNGHDAEDIFQATFLVLTRKAGSLRWHESVGNWLYQAAYRIALKAKTSAARRGVKEAKAAERVPANSRDDLSWREVETLLDEELHRLPVKYRAPLVFCYLEGSTRDEAAQQLGWSLSTLKRRLERGREMLRLRLVRRGLTFSAALFAPMLTQTTVKAALAPGLIQATVRSALQLAAGQSMAGLVSAPVAALVEGGLKTMFVTKLKVATAVLLAVSVVTAAGALSHQALAGKPVAPRATAAKPPEKTLRVAGAERSEAPDLDSKPGLRRLSPGHPRDELTYSGRVLGPDGKPVAGAKLYLTLDMGYLHEPSPSPEYATTGPDGRFTFTAPKTKVGDYFRFGDYHTVVAASAANYGPGWVEVAPGGKKDDLTLKLVKDDVPITGQIVDLEAKPIPGVTLTVMQMNAAPGEDFSSWLEAAKAKKGLSLALEQKYLKRHTIALCPKVTTDAEGRFRLTGIGRNRLVIARLDGPTIASQHLHILTGPEKTIEVTSSEGNPEYHEPREVTAYYGASFRYVAAPTKPIVGAVRDKDTKKPLAGVAIRSHVRVINPSYFRSLDTEVSTTTDAEGRFRLTGMPKGEGYKILAIPGGDQPYVVASEAVPDTPGLSPVTVDFALKRGVWIEGQITDKVTGKPLQASVVYYAMYKIGANKNPNLADYPGFDGSIHFHSFETKEDGSYRVVGLPGPGLVAVFGKQHYLRVIEREDEYGTKEPFIYTAPFHIDHPVNFGALARINPAKGTKSVRRDVTLDPGWAFKGTILGPEGKPVAGARVLNLNSSHIWWGREGMKTAAFTGWFNPHRPREFLLQDPDLGLVGMAHPPKENGSAVTVRMEPGATITGRLVDSDGNPLAGVELEVQFHPKEWGSWFGYSLERIQTDREGRFRAAPLLPGYDFRLSDNKGHVHLGGEFRSGQTKDLGDVHLKGNEE
jgi:RNA polymerase sigma factor (sigma-70 family)